MEWTTRGDMSTIVEGDGKNRDRSLLGVLSNVDCVGDCTPRVGVVCPRAGLLIPKGALFVAPGGILDGPGACMLSSDRAFRAELVRSLTSRFPAKSSM